MPVHLTPLTPDGRLPLSFLYSVLPSSPAVDRVRGVIIAPACLGASAGSRMHCVIHLTCVETSVNNKNTVTLAIWVELGPAYTRIVSIVGLW
jgi:hypothetical protein